MGGGDLLQLLWLVVRSESGQEQRGRGLLHLLELKPFRSLQEFELLGKTMELPSAAVL